MTIQISNEFQREALGNVPGRLLHCSDNTVHPVLGEPQTVYVLGSWEGTKMWTVWRAAWMEKKRKLAMGPQVLDWETLI